MNDTTYSPLPIQQGQNHICIIVYCDDMADCSSKGYNYLVSCKRPKLADHFFYMIRQLVILQTLAPVQHGWYLVLELIQRINTTLMIIRYSTRTLCMLCPLAVVGNTS